MAFMCLLGLASAQESNPIEQVVISQAPASIGKTSGEESLPLSTVSNPSEKKLVDQSRLQKEEEGVSSKKDGGGGSQGNSSLKTTPSPTTSQQLSSTAIKTETAMAMRIVLGLTFLAVLPAILVSLTAFLRIVIVLSMLRHAIGMQETPPNMVIIGLALFMTLFTMSPVIHKVNTDAFQPFMQNQIGMEVAAANGMRPIREFMVAQTREADIALMIELAHAPEPKDIEDVSNVQLIPAFMLSELRAAFQIGFLIFLPFLLIDLVVSSILMGLGMMMMPPTAIALPLKILMFILVDGWSLIMRALVGSFH